LCEVEHHRIVSSMSIAELSIGIMLMRAPAISVSAAVHELHVHGGLSVSSERVQSVFDDMMRREWIAPHPTEGDRLVMTSAGERVIWTGFNAVVKLIDQGQGSFEAAMLWSLVTRRSPDDLDS